MSTKKENLKIVLENMAYGADISRPEQRGLLSARKGDFALLFDMENRRLMGPFIVRTGPFHTSDTLWPNTKWNFVIGLKPSSIKIGVVEGRRLTDLIVERGRLSLRDPMTLITYWIHTVIYEEAQNFFEGFMDSATFISLDNLLKLYNVNTTSRWTPTREGDIALDKYVCNSLESLENTKKLFRSIPEYLIEASIARDTDFASSLIPAPNTSLIATGVYVYSRRYLDIAVYSSKPTWFAVIEVKRALQRDRELRSSVDQVSYYVYSLRKAFKLAKNRIYPIIVSLKVERGLNIPDTVRQIADHYDLRPDLYSLLEIRIKCYDNKPKIYINEIFDIG
ncbi:MAG: hypothetical protein F7C35_05040 [Desulfurococcales archaeon]|nr:hypothetical protein [Desulfurococcales archaeon]